MQPKDHCGQALAHPPPTVSVNEPTEPTRRRSQVNLSDLAYERIEELLVCCEPKQGRFMATHDLQALVGFGRAPVHQAVNRLAADTLLIVTQRHGIQIAPIDLTRERLLLRLRRQLIEHATGMWTPPSPRPTASWTSSKACSTCSNARWRRPCSTAAWHRSTTRFCHRRGKSRGKNRLLSETGIALDSDQARFGAGAVQPAAGEPAKLKYERKEIRCH